MSTEVKEVVLLQKGEQEGVGGGNKRGQQKDGQQRNNGTRGNQSNKKNRGFVNRGHGGAGGGGTGSKFNNSSGGQHNNSASNQHGGSQQKSAGNRGGQGDRNHEPRSKLMPILGASTLDMNVKEKTEQKFTGRCRVFIANLPNDMTEAKMRKLFEQFGEVAEVFLGKGNSFGFVKMDTRKNAETARDSLDYTNYENRTLRVRLAAHAAALRVKNLSPMVTNELLEYSFSHFGEVERAIVITDDRGRSTGEGIIEFARKSSAQLALKRCINDCFLLTSIPKPVYVEPFEQRDEEEGFLEKHVNRHQLEFRQEREVGPRFAEQGTFEYEFAMRWKKLFEMEKQKKDHLELEIQEARHELRDQMEYSRVEHQTKMLREQLRQMEEQSNKMVNLRTDRAGDERRREEDRQRQDMIMRQQEEEILHRSQVQDFGTLRRQENDLRHEASTLQNLLEREQAIRSMSTGVGAGNPVDPIFQNRAAYTTAMGDSPMVNAQPNLQAGMQHLQPMQGNMGPMMNNTMKMEMPPMEMSPMSHFGPGQGPPNMNPAMGGPLGPMGHGPGPNHHGPSPMRGVPNQHFTRPSFNQGPQNKRRRF